MLIFYRWCICFRSVLIDTSFPLFDQTIQLENDFVFMRQKPVLSRLLLFCIGVANDIELLVGRALQRNKSISYREICSRISMDDSTVIDGTVWWTRRRDRRQSERIRKWRWLWSKLFRAKESGRRKRHRLNWLLKKRWWDWRLESAVPWVMVDQDELLMSHDPRLVQNVPIWGQNEDGILKISSPVSDSF